MTTTVSIREAKNRLSELTRLAEAGERVTVTRNGAPVADIVPHEKPRGLDLEAARNWLRSQGCEANDIWIAPDFDDPLPEDFLITPEADSPDK